MKLLRGFIVFVDDSAIGSGELDRVSNDRAQHSLEIKSRADRLADFSQRFQFSDRSRQFARPRFQFLEQPDVLDGDDRLVGKGFEKRNLLSVNGRTSVRRIMNSPDGRSLAQQWRRENSANCPTSVQCAGFGNSVSNLCGEIMNVNCFAGR